MSEKKFKKNTYFLVPYIEHLNKEEGTNVFYIEEQVFNLKNMSLNQHVNKLILSSFDKCYLCLIPSNIKFCIARWDKDKLNIILNKNCKKHIEEITNKIIRHPLFKKYTQLKFSIEIKENEYFEIKADEYNRLLSIVPEEDLKNLLSTKNM